MGIGMEPLAGEVTSIAELFRRRVEASAQAEAYRIKRDGRWLSTSWTEFGSEVSSIAAALTDLDIGHGDAVAILGETTPAWGIADLAAIVLGGHSVGIYQTLLLDQVQFILEDSQARVLFVQGQAQFERVLPLLDSLPHLKALIVWDHEPAKHDGVLSFSSLLAHGVDRPLPMVDVASSDVALIVYTSGTTGQPKGVPLTHENLLAHLRSGEAFLPELITSDDITLSFLPMAHVAEHVPGFMGRLNLGLAAAFASSHDTLLDELREVRPTYFGAVPRIFEKMYGRMREEVARTNPRRQRIFAWAESLARKKARWDMGGPALSLWERQMYRLADRLVYGKIRAVFGGRVKTFLTGAAPMNIEILEFFHGVGMTILEVYGLSETTAIAFANVPGSIRHGTVGQALPGVEVKMAEDGEVLLKGAIVFGGYLNLEVGETFDDEGFFRTGDIGVIDDDGFLKLTDRKKNLLKTAGGKYVAPSRLEALVKEEALISQVYVHGDLEKYVVALVTLDERETERVAAALETTVEALPEHPEVLRRVETAVERANTRLARFEQIKRHTVVHQDFSVDQGTLTPTLKIKRREVARLYTDAIRAMYD